MAAEDLQSFREVEPGVGIETFTGYRKPDGTVVQHGQYQIRRLCFSITKVAGRRGGRCCPYTWLGYAEA
jgi:hypothetical protein